MFLLIALVISIENTQELVCVFLPGKEPLGRSPLHPQAILCLKTGGAKGSVHVHKCRAYKKKSQNS